VKKILVLVLLCLPLLAAGPATPARPEAASPQLAALLADYEKLQLEENLGDRIQRGLPVVKLPDFSYEDAKKEAGVLRGFRSRLERIDAKRLRHEDWLTREILARELADAVTSVDHFWAFFQVTPYSSPLRSLHRAFTSFKFTGERDLPRYLDLLRQYGRAAGQLRANLETQRAKGILLPKAEIDPVVELVRSFVKPPAESLFTVAPERLGAIAPARAAAFAGEVRKLVEAVANPALTALADLPDAPAYRAAAPERVGLGQYPGGQEAYSFLVRLHTTLDLTPGVIHQRGLREVVRLNGRLEEMRRKVGFEGDLPAFRQFLKTDPRFFAKTPEEVSARLLAPVRRIEPRIKDFFLHTPKAPYGVARLQPELEGAMTYGYYQQPTPEHPEGVYRFNGQKLSERTMLWAAALIYHELIPGHHFQISLQQEDASLPALRKSYYPTAFVEGWATYSSELAEEMGGYPDPYDLCGLLASDLFLASRLVVDTGMNSLGWSRQEAIDYLRQNTFESDTQIGTETLRYAVDMPAQALAYKIGAAKIWEVRREAEKELGAKFDLRRFHDAVLGGQAMPMNVLEQHVGWWIEGEKKRKEP
jgi:uncharacterized protein (DUF885 family)